MRKLQGNIHVQTRRHFSRAFRILSPLSVQPTLTNRVLNMKSETVVRRACDVIVQNESDVRVVDVTLTETFLDRPELRHVLKIENETAC